MTLKLETKTAVVTITNDILIINNNCNISPIVTLHDILYEANYNLQIN